MEEQPKFYNYTKEKQRDGALREVINSWSIILKENHPLVGGFLGLLANLR